jgi:hypothetical protein
MSRRKWIIPGCALLAIVVVGIVLVIAPAAVALRLAGFRSEGSTDDYLSEQASVAPPTIRWPAGSAPLAPLTPTPNAASPADGASSPPATAGPLPEPLDELLVDVWFLSGPTTFYAADIHAERLERGRVEDSKLAYYIEFDQVGINACLSHWFGVYVAQEERVRNAWIDLQPGGAVVYADVNLELGWQRAGAVFMLDASGRQLVLVGVDIDGRLYSTPPAGSIADLVAQLEAETNRALRELIFLDSAGQLAIQRISISQDRVQILAY